MIAKLLIAGGVLSLIPIWKDVTTNEGMNLWEYLYSTAFTKRKHITPEEAVQNYRRNMGYD